MTYHGYYESPIGLIEVGGTSGAITQLKFVDKPRDGFHSHATIIKSIEQIEAYFQGKRRKFDLPLEFTGTEFQKQVWQQLQKIPYGMTASYKDIAARIGNPQASRAVGGANNRNPISIIVPCHRIIGANGDLVGYGGGIWRKEWLLNHERA